MSQGREAFHGGDDMNKKKQSEHHPDCKTICGGTEVPTQEEIAVLKTMKDIKERVRILKTRLSELDSRRKNGDLEAISKLQGEMERLKTQWEQWDEKRRETARSRMIMLGHEVES